MAKTNVKDLFNLNGRVTVITGGAGLLGEMHAEAIVEAGGIAVLADMDAERAEKVAADVSKRCGGTAAGIELNVADQASAETALASVVGRFGRVDALINNAARNPKMENASLTESSRLEHYDVDEWNRDLAVGLTGAFICSRVFGGHMASRGSGVILNISSDLGVIGPDQRIYREPGVPDERQKVKPVSYPVVKGGLVQLTRYLATYWADRNVRVNALSPGGVENGQPDEFVARLTNLIPLGRMARRDEYKGAVVFLCSDASSYMTGSNVVIDGGRTCW